MSAISSDEQVELLFSKIDRLQEEGRYEEALQLADEAIAAQPKALDPHFARGCLLWEMGRDEEALVSLERAHEIDKRDPFVLLTLADLVLHTAEDEAGVERAVDLCRRGRKEAAKLQEDETEGQLLLLEALCLVQLEAFQEAIEKLDEAEARIGAEPELLQIRGETFFHLCRFDEARRDLETLIALEPEAPVGHHYLGLLAEREGNVEVAKERFATARKLAPEEFPEPIHLSEEEFDRVVEDAIAQLPQKVRDYLSNIAITVEPFPPTEEISGPDPLSPTILGVFRGTPKAEKGLFDPWSHFPNSIVLYQANLERYARSKEELIEEIGITLIHEVGHFLGLDEDELTAMGLD